MTELEQELYHLSLRILDDECPPENCMYLCNMHEERECDCRRCWDKYLMYVINGRRYDPYKYDRKREDL